MLNIYFGDMEEAIYNTAVYCGVKTLILVANDKKHVFNASTCGDNCAKWLLVIGETGKVTINLRHLMDFGEETFKIRVLNTGKIVHNMKELVLEAGRYV